MFKIGKTRINEEALPSPEEVWETVSEIVKSAYVYGAFYEGRLPEAVEWSRETDLQRIKIIASGNNLPKRKIDQFSMPTLSALQHVLAMLLANADGISSKKIRKKDFLSAMNRMSIWADIQYLGSTPENLFTQCLKLNDLKIKYKFGSKDAARMIAVRLVLGSSTGPKRIKDFLRLLPDNLSVASRRSQKEGELSRDFDNELASKSIAALKLGTGKGRRIHNEKIVETVLETGAVLRSVTIVSSEEQ